MNDAPKLWTKDFAIGDADYGIVGLPYTEWHSVDGRIARLYLTTDEAPDASWTWLQPVLALAGASEGELGPFHYVVETDVDPANERELNAWYADEHLPGLASVPGTIRAARYERAEGSPRFFACYDLTTPATLERSEWLAVRHTDWSSRVRPMFKNTRRTMFQRPPSASMLVPPMTSTAATPR